MNDLLKSADDARTAKILVKDAVNQSGGLT